ncbi:MAG: alpha-D-glucose phosphate-specific phosphoglucomutase [Acidobacteriaceae bacterium]
MKLLHVTASPYADQRPGTSGLRKKVTVFQQPAYLELFIQAICNALPNRHGATWILGGDGRYFNDQAIQIILRIAAANGIARVVVGQHGILSTPAVSHLIRKRNALGGIILTASHNPGGPAHDFGVKYNASNGGPAPESLTEQIWAISRDLHAYQIIDGNQPIDIASKGEHPLGNLIVEVCDPTTDYMEMMESIFDFDKIASLLRSKNFSLRYDALHAVTGPYAKELFEHRLGAPEGSVVHGTPLPDFGGLHPDPNLVYGKTLVDVMFRPQAPDFGAASDGDGDRHMILGREFFVSPGDSLAILLAHAHRIPAYRDKVHGVARSLPTSLAVDDVANMLQIPLYETPTGWKYFGDLMDAGKVTFCGEESFGAGSTHIREKDGLWAVLFWLSILADSQKSVAEIVRDLWLQHGRHYFTRHDFESLPAPVAQDIVADLKIDLKKLPGKVISGIAIQSAEDFSYHDPIDGSLVEHQGIRIIFADRSRVVIRLSGTGTTGATLRLYFERFVQSSGNLHLNVQQALSPFMHFAYELTGILRRTGRSKADVIT